MRLNEVTRSHVRGQSSPNLNLYLSAILLPPLPLARSTLVTRIHGGSRGMHNSSPRNSRKTIELDFVPDD